MLDFVFETSYECSMIDINSLDVISSREVSYLEVGLPEYGNRRRKKILKSIVSLSVKYFNTA